MLVFAIAIVSGASGCSSTTAVRTGSAGASGDSGDSGAGASGGSGGGDSGDAATEDSGDAAAALGQAIHWKGACARLEDARSSALAFGAGEAFTVELWFEIEPTLERYQTLVQKGGAIAADPGWQFFLSRTVVPPTLSTPFALSYCVGDGAGAYGCASSGELTPGKYHLALVRSPGTGADASSATMTVFYLPPNASVHASATRTTPTSSWTTTLPFQISSCGSLTGTMDELRIWKTARTERELFAYASTPLDCRSEPDLVAYYDFEDLTRGTLQDCHATFDVPIVPGPLPDSWEPVPSPF
jgi:hypothetical protein